MVTTAAIECIAFRRQQSIILFSCNRILGRGANSRPNQHSLKSIVHSSSLYKLAAILLFIVYHNNLKLCLSRKNVYRIGMHVTKILHSCVFQMCGFDIHKQVARCHWCDRARFQRTTLLYKPEHFYNHKEERVDLTSIKWVLQ